MVEACRSSRIAFAFLLATASGCALTHHTAARYRNSPAAAEAVEARASDHCRDLGHPAGVPRRPFVTDGCSIWPDGVWQDCCVEHDMAYWCGGTRDQRRAADERLRACVAAKQGVWTAALMHVGVRVGGFPWVPARWRWGYGHAYPARYRCAPPEPQPSPP